MIKISHNPARRPPKKKPVQPVRKSTLLRKDNAKAKRHSLPSVPEKPKAKRKWWQLFF